MNGPTVPTQAQGQAQAAGCPVPLGGERFLAGPARFYRELRRDHGPVAPIELPGGVPAWLVLGYRELHQVTSDPVLFSRDSALWNMWDRIPENWPMLPMVGKQPSILYTVGERHRRRSAVLGDALADVDPFELRDHVERFADDLIDTFCGRGGADLAADYAKMLPALVLARLYGFPDADGKDLAHAVNALVNGGADAIAGARHATGAMQWLLESRRAVPDAAGPPADVAGRMLAHPNAGEFTLDELVQDMRVIMTAGHQPTADWIGNSLRLMLTDDRFAASLTGGRHSVAEAMNEVLWEDTPTQNIAGRWATRDTRLAGTRIRSGDLLVLSFAAANGDPQVRPDQHALTGGNNAFFSFGHGEHRCPYPAQEIAETIARKGIEVLLDRLPDVDLAVAEHDLVWRPSPWLRGLVSLPVHFTPTHIAGGSR
ncbi:cytochrome P450 [Streptomyces sp. DSM 42041]|uniref:Cytochrome P450 n=1 Tax=Streptomyces hazeniae TaxID=3075538 RepID=A0ABU2NYS8_9ACTN|nr:cytochrome P450 [Streptomyces sp. DSM 42041]MDT0381786.1 cytochrome P450 [Streptomyces sp. DSM 42041]